MQAQLSRPSKSCPDTVQSKPNKSVDFDRAKLSVHSYQKAAVSEPFSNHIFDGSSRILVGAEGGLHAEFSAVEEDSNAEVLELAEAFGG